MTDRFRRLIESLPHMVWMCDAEGACRYLSPQWVAYTGRPEDELLGDKWLACLHPADVGITVERWTAAVRAGLPFDTEFRVRRHDGLHRWFKTRAVRAETDDAKVIWCGTNTDIEELKEARAEADAANGALASRVAERTRDLEHAHARLAEAQRVSQVGSWSYDLRSGLVLWSDELFRIFRLAIQPMAPSFEQHDTLYTPESLAVQQASVAETVATGTSYELSLGIVRGDGEIGVAIARGEAVRGDGGVVALIGTLQDVTERERTNRALRVTSERLDLARKAARLGIWEWDVRSGSLIWDDGMYELYGIKGDGFVGVVDAWRDALHPEDAAATNAALADAVAGRGTFDVDFRIVMPNGGVRHIRAAASVERDPDGAALRMIGVNQDVTPQRLAELARRKSEALQRAVLANAGAAIIATDIAGTITLFSPAAEAMLGYEAADVVGKMTAAVMHDRDEVAAVKAALEAELGAPIEDTGDVFVLKARLTGVDVKEWNYVRKDGQRVPVLLTLTVLRDDAGDITGYLGIAVDLTQRKRGEQELQELNQLLAERSRQREVLLQEVHHRVKNNLQVISSLINLQVRQLDDPAARAALAVCSSRVQTIALIHEQLYRSHDYAQIPFADYARQLAQNIFAASGVDDRIELRFDISPVSLTVEKAIPCGLILNELLTNAIKHAFPESRRGVVEVHLSSHDGDVSLRVADDGVGSAVAPSAESTSLGLHLVSTLAGQLDGAVTLERGAGSRFDLRFPLRGEHG